MADQLTPAQFAKAIKAKYPQYASVPDDQLAHAVVTKYPQYASQVNFGGDTVSAAPKVGTKDWLKSAVYTGIDKALPFLPAAGATAGGLLAAPGVVSAPMGAAEGAVIGEGARAVLNRAIFGEHIDPNEEAKNIAEQFALGAGSELGARGAGALGSRLLKPFAEAATAMKAAKAGTGVRMTPGEAAGSSMLRRVEDVLTHLPGSAGPMEKFRAAQATEANKLMDTQVEALSKVRMNDEQAGQAVQSALQKTAKARTDNVNLKYDELKDMLGVPKGTYMTQDEINEAIQKKAEFHKQYGVTPPPFAAKLAEAKRAAYGAANAPEADAIERILKVSPEQIVEKVQSGYSLRDLREFNQVVPPQQRQQVAANVLQKMIYDANEAKTGGTGLIKQGDLAKAIKDMGDVRGSLIFGQQYPAVKEGVELLNRISAMATDQTGGVGKMHALREIVQGAAIGGQLFAMQIGRAGEGALATAGAYGTMRTIALLLTHPQTSAFMLKVLRGAAVTGARAIPYGVDAALISPADVHDVQQAAQ